LEAPSEDHLTTKEAAKYVGVSESSLRRDRRDRQYGIQFITLGPRLIRYSRAELQKWLKERSSNVSSPIPEGGK